MLALTALEQAEALRRGDFTSEELVRAYLDRVAEHNPRVSAFVTVLRRRALARARAADRRRGPDVAPFHGVPTGVKDIDMVRGAFMKAGSRSLRYVVAPVDGGAARAIRAGGFVIAGKTATSELGIMPVTEPDVHPPTRNPWSPEHSAGGSSGGAAAAVAAGLLPIAHASDGAGSIRIPASFCHLFGMKPSRKLVPNFYAGSDELGLVASGCVARSVADSAAMLDVMRGAREQGPETLLARCAGDPGRLRVRLTLDSPLVDVRPEIAAAVEGIASRLEAMGHQIVSGPPLAVGVVEEFIPLMARAVAGVPVPRRRLLQPVTAWMREIGKTVPRAAAQERMAELSARVRAWFADAELALMPTVGLPPPRVGAYKDCPSAEQAFLAASQLGAFTAPWNVSGQPAASLPAGLSSEGLPIGVQLVGPPDGDVRVLQVARQLEQAAPWRERVSPLFAR